MTFSFISTITQNLLLCTVAVTITMSWSHYICGESNSELYRSAVRTSRMFWQISLTLGFTSVLLCRWCRITLPPSSISIGQYRFAANIFFILLSAHTFLKVILNALVVNTNTANYDLKSAVSSCTYYRTQPSILCLMLTDKQNPAIY